MDVKAVLRKSASKLMKEKVITSVEIASLEPLIPKCKLLIMENNNRDIVLKLIFEEKRKFTMCGTKSLRENEQLLL